jgi:predicted Zn-dependent protease
MKRLVIEEANGNFDENIKLLNEGLKKEPENVDYNYYLMRNHLFLNNDTAAASRYAREVIKIDKNGYLANRAYGLLFIIKGDIANNIKYSELAFEQNPEDNELGNYLYNYYKSQNNSLKEKYYDEAIKKQKSKSTF